MLVAALEIEVAAYLEAHRGERDEDGHALVVHNGSGRTRKVTVGAGTIPVSAPRVNDRRTDQEGERRRFTSRILPPYMRRSPKVAEVLPVLYLRGLSTGDFREALAALLGDDAAGLSATNIARLTNEWETEFPAGTSSAVGVAGVMLPAPNWSLALTTGRGLKGEGDLLSDGTGHGAARQALIPLTPNPPPGARSTTSANTSRNAVRGHPGAAPRDGVAPGRAGNGSWRLPRPRGRATARRRSGRLVESMTFRILTPEAAAVIAPTPA
jgi:hypothetical protein